MSNKYNSETPQYRFTNHLQFTLHKNQFMQRVSHKWPSVSVLREKNRYGHLVAPVSSPESNCSKYMPNDNLL